MNIHSIRWRLPLSYVAIALLAALSLGSVMLLVLKIYYAGLERAYLNDQAIALAPIVEQVLLSDASPQVLQDQVVNLASFSHIQIRVLDENNRLLADSNLSNAWQVVAVSISPTEMMLSTPSASAPAPTQTDTGTRKLGGYAFFVETIPGSAQRSSQMVRLKFKDVPGATLEIYSGPAYGSDIIRSVAIAWAVAGIFSIALAAWAGWLVSKQVTRPVMALTEATRRMEQGELSTRVALPAEKQKEFVALAHSFNSMAQQVEGTVFTLRAFVSDAAHELNTPLTALKINLELAANEPDAARKQNFLAHAIEQNERLGQLTNSLLDLSRIESAQAAPDFSLLDLRQLTAETGERFASRAEQADRNFNLTLPESSVPVRGNAGQLQRALDNLLENALKFTPPGGTIILTLETAEDTATLTITDTGIGISPEDLPHLFERFHRGRNVADYAGNGLGLAIVQAVMDSQGGTIRAESGGMGKGSTFVIVFPEQGI